MDIRKINTYKNEFDAIETVASTKETVPSTSSGTDSTSAGTTAPVAEPVEATAEATFNNTNKRKL